MVDRKSLIALGIALVLAAAVFAVMRPWNSGDDKSGYVKVACRDWVKDRLKSPASADFSNENISHDGQTYVVTGAVDSENSFGAPIRNTYRCEAKNDGGASTLVSLSGIGN